MTCRTWRASLREAVFFARRPDRAGAAGAATPRAGRGASGWALGREAEKASRRLRTVQRRPPSTASGSLCRRKVGPVGRWETRPGHASVKVIGHSAEPVVKAVLQNRHRGPAPGQMTGLAPPAGRPHSQALQTLPPATHIPQVQPARLPLALVPSVKVTKARQAPDMLRRNIINFTGEAKTKTKKTLLETLSRPLLRNSGPSPLCSTLACQEHF